MGGMEFADVVRRRKMVRNYTDEPVDPAVVDRALANAARAPSAGFSQGWGFLVLDAPDDVRRFWVATVRRDRRPGRVADRHDARADRDRAVLSKAAYLGRYAEPDKGWTDRDEARWPVPFWHMDAAMASLLILQTPSTRDSAPASSAFRPRRRRGLRAEFAIPKTFDPVGAITLGHPADSPGAKGSPPGGDARTSRRSCTAAAGVRATDMGTVHPIRAPDAT